MSAYAHTWGKSQAADRVWSHVNGLAPVKADRRLLMIWQAYIDESIDSGLFVLAGYLASAENWAAFAREWEQMLSYGILGSDGKFRFKMAEMASLPERMNRVPAFYRIIERHVSIGLSLTIRVDDFYKGRDRVIVFNEYGQIVPVSGEVYENTYLFAFTRLMNIFHGNGHKNDMRDLLGEDKVDFIFDERSEKRAILSSWDQFLDGNQHRDQYGATPRFENDDEFLPLQAADFIAWWMRKWTREARADFAAPFPWKTRAKLPMIRAIMTEDNVFEDFCHLATRQPGKQRRVFDRNTLVSVPFSTVKGELFKFSLGCDGVEFASVD